MNVQLEPPNFAIIYDAFKQLRVQKAVSSSGFLLFSFVRDVLVIICVLMSPAISTRSSSKYVSNTVCIFPTRGYNNTHCCLLTNICCRVQNEHLTRLKSSLFVFAQSARWLWSLVHSKLFPKLAKTQTDINVQGDCKDTDTGETFLLV